MLMMVFLSDDILDPYPCQAHRSTKSALLASDQANSEETELPGNAKRGDFEVTIHAIVALVDSSGTVEVLLLVKLSSPFYLLHSDFLALGAVPSRL